MSSCEFKTWIGEDELDVWVCFDYQPAEEATTTYPGCEWSITIGSVEVRFIHPKEIMECLNSETLAKLWDDCLEYMEEEQ